MKDSWRFADELQYKILHSMVWIIISTFFTRESQVTGNHSHISLARFGEMNGLLDGLKTKEYR